MANEMTGSGTCIEVYANVTIINTMNRSGLHTIDKLVDPSVKVSPEEHSTPKVAQISPGPIEGMSWVHILAYRKRIVKQDKQITSISLLCMRTNRGTLTFFPVRAL